MTTPERIRRRQRREFTALAVLAVFMVAQAVYFNIQSRDQKQCIADKVNQITAVFQARSKLADQDTALNLKQFKYTSHIILAVGSISSAAQFHTIEAVYKARVGRITAQRMAIATQRLQHPVPNFPPGACGSSTPAKVQISALNTLAAGMP